MLLTALVAGCSSSVDRADVAGRRTAIPPGTETKTPPPAPKPPGTVKIGAPYRIADRWYVPRHDPGYDATGTASWYGGRHHGRKTANGELFDREGLTAAHPTLPLPSYVTVTNLANGRTLLVRVNDRGPFVRDRIVDLSERVARLLDFESKGTARVRVRFVGFAPLDGNDARERAVLARQPWAPRSAVAGTTRPWPGSARPPSGLGAKALIDIPHPTWLPIR